VRVVLCLIGLGLLSTVSNFSSQGVSQSGLQNRQAVADAGYEIVLRATSKWHDFAKRKNVDAANVGASVR
jgi:hypothetical protein